MMIDFIGDIAVITTLIFFSSRIFKTATIYSSKLAWSNWTLAGLLNGVFGIILMFFSVDIPPNSIFDLRQVFILVAASIGGVYAAALSAAVIVIARIALFGGINHSSITAIVSLLAIGIAAGVVFEFKRWPYWLKWALAMALSAIDIIVSFLYLLPRETGLHLLSYFLPTLLCGELFAAYLVRYVTSSNQLFLRREQEATTDFLTQINNVRSFDQIFNEIATNADKKDENLSLLMIDIDHFKRINDQFGHPAGDAILKELAKMLRTTARSFDIISRNGGEEFSILLPDCPNNYLRVVAERVRLTIEKHVFRLAGGSEVKITVSVGGANYPHVPLDALIEAADRSLFQAKQNGRNCVCLFTNEIKEEAGVPARSL